MVWSKPRPTAAVSTGLSAARRQRAIAGSLEPALQPQTGTTGLGVLVITPLETQMTQQTNEWTDPSARTENARRIASAMRVAGMTSIRLEYAGEGDAGTGFTVATTPEGTGTAKMMFLAPRYDLDARTMRYDEKLASIGDAFESFAGDWLQAVHGEYDTGLGGYGTVTLGADGQAKLDHYERIEDTNQTETLLDTGPLDVTAVTEPA